MIDWSRVNELKAEIGEEGFAEVVDLFLEEVEAAMAALTPDAAPRMLEQDIHFLKGSAWNLGFVEFGALCHDGERRATRGALLPADLDRIRACYATSKTAFLGGLGTRAATSAV